MDDDDDLICIDELCRIFGGQSSPIHRATAYRHVAAGRIHTPFRIGGLSRWSRRRALDDRRRMIEARAERDDRAAA